MLDESGVDGFGSLSTTVISDAGSVSTEDITVGTKA